MCIYVTAYGSDILFGIDRRVSPHHSLFRNEIIPAVLFAIMPLSWSNTDRVYPRSTTRIITHEYQIADHIMVQDFKGCYARSSWSVISAQNPFYGSSDQERYFWPIAYPQALGSRLHLNLPEDFCL